MKFVDLFVFTSNYSYGYQEQTSEQCTNSTNGSSNFRTHFE